MDISHNSEPRRWSTLEHVSDRHAPVDAGGKQTLPSRITEAQYWLRDAACLNSSFFGERNTKQSAPSAASRRAQRGRHGRRRLPSRLHDLAVGRRACARSENSPPARQINLAQVGDGHSCCLFCS